MLIKLSLEECNELKKIVGPVQTTFDTNQNSIIEECILNLSVDAADEYRNACQDELEVTGFDHAYNLTPKGKILESLIDKLFTG